ncbi:MFS general substrate transporter [Gonapodya prolifera JEL478]|uniref:MFS general substrate transporter n=1 Tax=Gonapodya prolifera (strain JEL478) TaxID=1344416 RepID=A0A139AJY2_GONPJ|nr:MFS general substrate transporter [Gonapodya prolifera JEL478]|eukprot:KXS17079.1 MFS general substrate transporter [Gonapodya prolifera JEL478]
MTGEVVLQDDRWSFVQHPNAPGRPSAASVSSATSFTDASSYQPQVGHLRVVRVDRADWTPEEEARVVRKVDMVFIPWLILCYTALNIDRVNISYAAIMNAENPGHTIFAQLGLDGDKFNWAVSVFFFGYVLFEIPSNLVITYFNPSRWLGRIMTSWGIVATCAAAAQNYSGILTVRAILGCMEAGFAPGTALLMTFWYKKYEVSSRWAYMFAGATLLSSFGGLVAFGVAKMDDIRGISGWRWMFILEGAGSTLVGILTIFFLPDYPQTCKFLTVREKEIIIGRLPPTGPSIVAKTIQFWEVVDALKDWRMYAFSLALMCELATVYSAVYFLPLVIHQMGFQSETAQLLSIPPYMIAAVWITFINWSSDRYQEKAWHGLCCLVLPIIGFFCLALFQGGLSPGGRYGLIFLTTLAEGVVPIIIGLSTISTKGTSRTALRSAFTVACGNIGGAIGGQIYQQTDGPFFVRGHFINAGLLILVLVIFLIAVWSLIQEGEYLGHKANITVFERGGIEVENQVLSVDHVLELTRSNSDRTLGSRLSAGVVPKHV